jgi:hypothetical protein
MFLTATTSSVAPGSMYEYQFQMRGTKKCHNPKPIVTALPAVIRILPSKYIVYPPNILSYTIFFTKDNKTTKPIIHMTITHSHRFAQFGENFHIY